MVRPSPDVEEDQRPEVDDRQAIRIDRPFGSLWNEIVHDRQETGGQEKADRVVAVPPLNHRVLDARPDGIGLGGEDRDRHLGVVAEDKHGDRHDKGEIEPVGYINMRLLPLSDSGHIDEKVSHPNNNQPYNRVPFRLGVFVASRDAEQITGSSNEDEEVITEDHEPWREIAGQTHPTRALDDIKRGCEKNVAAECENHGRCMQWAQSAEIDQGEVEV